jgi:capsid portal protein
MDSKELCLDFIKNFYSITISSEVGDKTIILHDCLEKYGTKKIYWMGQIMGYDVFLVWDKAEQITNIDIHKKENSELKSELIKCLKNSQTFSFLKYNLDMFDKSNKKISYNLQEIKEEFPVLFG